MGAIDAFLKFANAAVCTVGVISEAINIGDTCIKDTSKTTRHIPDAVALCLRAGEKLTENTSTKMGLKVGELAARGISVVLPGGSDAKKGAGVLAAIRSIFEICALTQKSHQEAAAKDPNYTVAEYEVACKMIPSFSPYSPGFQRVCTYKYVGEKPFDYNESKSAERSYEGLALAASAAEVAGQAQDIRQNHRNVGLAHGPAALPPVPPPALRAIPVRPPIPPTPVAQPNPPPTCPITQDEIKEPSRARQHQNQFYEYLALATWVEQAHTNPLTRERMDHADIELVNFV